MATKITGLGDNYYISGYDVSGATNSLSKIAAPQNVLDFTDITESGYERKGGLRDGQIDFVTYLDTTSVTGAHALYSQLQTTDVIASYFVKAGGFAAGNPAACMVAKQLNYNFTRAADGMLTAQINLVANADGLEWCKALTAPKRTDLAATVGPFYDNGAAFNFGAQAYVQLFAFSGTSVTIDIQSATTSGGSYSTTGLTTVALTSAPQAVRLQVANNTTINEFIKVVTTGTFSNAVFAVAINVNTIAGVTF